MTPEFKKQLNLQKQAAKVLDNSGLLKILSKYGEVKIVGSLALGLMVWPDIDLDLLSRKKINETDYFEIVQKLFKIKNIKQLILIDNRGSFEKNRPNSMYIGINYRLGDLCWKIDIRYLNRNDARADKDIETIKNKLSADKIESILKIKGALFEHSKYRREFSAPDIYKAVLDCGIKSVSVFKKSLKDRGVKI